MTATLNLAFRSPDGLIEVKACHVLCKRVFNNPDSPAIPLPVETAERCVLATFAGDKVVGTGLVVQAVPRSRIWQIYSLAVEVRYQRTYGIGTQMVALLEQYAKEHGAQRVELSAFKRAQPFYTRLGYSFKYPNSRSTMMFKDI